jgi:hypothetical protein
MVGSTRPFVDGPIVRTATGFDKRRAEIWRDGRVSVGEHPQV